MNSDNPNGKLNTENKIHIIGMVGALSLVVFGILTSHFSITTRVTVLESERDHLLVETRTLKDQIATETRGAAVRLEAVREESIRMDERQQAAARIIDAQAAEIARLRERIAK